MFSSRRNDSEDNDLAIARLFNDTPQEYRIAAAAFVSGVLATSIAIAIHRRYIRRLPNSEWITPDILNKKRWLKGRVTSIGDNDNFRLYHTPWFGWRWPLKFRNVPSASKDLKDQTIHIRLAGVDAPEGAHFGRPSQKFSEESLAWLKSQIEGQTVYCQLLRKDQYARIVAMVHLKPRLLPNWIAKGKNVSMEMLRAGWGVTYEQAGAEYGKWGKEEFQRLEAEARTSRKGIWRHGTPKESPAEYKRRYATSAEQAETATQSVSKEPRRQRRASRLSLWQRIFRPSP